MFIDPMNDPQKDLAGWIPLWAGSDGYSSARLLVIVLVLSSSSYSCSTRIVHICRTNAALTESTQRLID
jgi:hypothetical protein